jgi:bifunctional non-homologous end joining protein LigD
MLWHNARPRQRSRTAPATFIDPCLPTKVQSAPTGNTWAHEIKHDGYRIQIHVTNADVRLYTMSGYDWTDRYPLIVNAARKLKGAAIIDAEAAILGADGISDFEALHNRTRNAEAVAFAFDVMMLDGRDVRHEPWLIRRRMLKRLLLGRRASGLSYSKEIVGRGDDVYQAACRMGLEGIVSKRLDAPYRSGKVKTWLKIKNPAAPGMTRFALGEGDPERLRATSITET